MWVYWISQDLFWPHNKKSMKVMPFDITCVFKMHKLKHKSVDYFALGCTGKWVETDLDDRPLLCPVSSLPEL